jgi:hypothetical protein
MAYSANDYNALLLWSDPTSGAKCQCKLTVNSALTPSDIADALDVELAAGGTGTPTVYMNDHCALIQIDMFSLGIGGTVFIKTDTTAQGQQGGGATPINSAMVATFLGDLPGRKHRNRVYWPFIDRGFLTDDGALWNPGAVSGAEGAWDTFRTTLEGDNVHMRIQNHKDAATEDIASVRVNTYIGTQRRRAERFE